MGVENCCLRPEEKKDEIHTNQINEEINNSFPQDSQQINNLETNNQIQSQQLNQNASANQQISPDKVGNTHEISINENENEKSGNYNIKQGIDLPKQNEDIEKQAEEQMEEQAEELGEGEEEGQVVEVHEEVEIEDIIPGKEGDKFEDLNPIDQLGETVVQTTYINNPNNINNNNYIQEELNGIFNIEGNNISKPADSYVDYNSQNIPLVSTASTEGAFDLNNIQIQPNETNDINSQNVNYYSMSSGAAVPINYDNNANTGFDLNNLGQNIGNFDLNNLNVDSSNNYVDNSQYNLESKNYNNDLNSLIIKDSNIGSGANYSIEANPLGRNMTFGIQNEGNNYENIESLQALKSNVEGSSYINPGQTTSYNYSYSVPENSVSQY